MLLPLALVTVGGILVYSALSGLSVVDILSGKTGSTLDPSGSHATSPSSNGGGSTATGDVVPGQNWTAPPGGTHGFKGPHAQDLNNLAGIAQNNFGLRITATDNGTHVPGSYHYRNEAFDAAGAEAGMRGFAQYVLDHYGNEVSELIHNPGYAVKDGQTVNGAVVYAAVWAGHRDHVHVGWG